ncbi:MAG: hypothetical protein NTY36_03625 [Deltaproteobacteria bacterium]|nr:hypothetical protein [Deltaproteobacteria bacterium]
MRAKIAVLSLTALVILGLSVSQALAVNSVNYLGKTTWTAAITDDTDPTAMGNAFTVTGGISKVGDEFYLFQGYVIPEGDGPFVLSGSGFMNGNTLVFTLSSSQDHTNKTHRDSGVMHVSIDKTTLNGTFYDISTIFDKDARTFGQHYTAGTLTLKGQPIPLAPALAGLQQLLLLDQ